MIPAIKKILTIFKNIGMLFFILGAYSASAYETLQAIPGIDKGSTPSLSQYLKQIYLTGVGLAGVLAVLMIVIGGIQYIGSGMSPSAKEDARGKITNAILGLLLALGSWLILHTINPDLVSLKF
jgi:hypothetical protein